MFCGEAVNCVSGTNKQIKIIKHSQNPTYRNIESENNVNSCINNLQANLFQQIRSFTDATQDGAWSEPIKIPVEGKEHNCGGYMGAYPPLGGCLFYTSILSIDFVAYLLKMQDA